MSTSKAAREKFVEARERLESRTNDHPRFNEVFAKIKAEIDYPTDTKLLLVIGPTGVGKTHLFRQVKTYVERKFAESDNPDPGVIPCVAFEVANANQYNFSWAGFYRDYVDMLRLPLPPDRRIVRELPHFDRRDGPDAILMNTLRHRRPLVTLLDEAHHMARVTNPRNLRHHMEHIKSVANRSNVLHICFGTYDLAEMINLSGQLARRIRVIHYSRYRLPKNTEDVGHFADAVWKFQEAVKVAHFFDLRTQKPYLYMHSLGCVGTLKEWVVRAISRAQSMERAEISLADLKATELEAPTRYRILEEITKGEKCLSESLSPEQDVKLLEMMDDTEIQPDLFEDSNLAGLKKPRKVGDPNPKRHHVPRPGHHDGEQEAKSA